MPGPRTLFSSSEESISVGQLYRKTKNAIAKEFRGPVWVSGEIKAMREMRGNLYLQLIEPGDHADGSDLSVDVAIWSKRHQVLKAQLADAGITLAAGMEVKVSGNVTLSKVSRLQLELVDLDTDALVGRQATEKKRLYDALRQEDLLEANKRNPLSPVPLRIGLVTSENSEGHNDFVGQLNRSPFKFTVTLRHSAVQGPTAAATVARAIDSFAGAPVDIICVVRGGGGELDAFDKEPVARAIANAGVPVWTGIGHTGDRAVADDVAHSTFITPTECGQAVVRRVGSFIDRTSALTQRLSVVVERQIAGENNRINNLSRHLSVASSRRTERESANLHRLGQAARAHAQQDVALGSATLQALSGMLRRGFARHLSDETKDLAQRRAQLSAYDPKKQLQRGYTIVRGADGSMIRSAADLKTGDKLVTTFADGSASSTVNEVNTEGN